MSELTERARGLLRKGEVDVVAGYVAGSDPLKTAPCFIHDPEDCARLVWNPFCVNNLAVYLPRLLAEGVRAAAVVKGCDAMSAVEQVKLNRFGRDKVVLMGVTCEGVVDLGLLREKIGLTLEGVVGVEGTDPLEVETVDGGRLRVPLPEVRPEKCSGCAVRNPRGVDIVIGDEIVATGGEGFTSSVIERVLEMEAPERASYWESFFERCLRCHACKAVCPGCACERCPLEEPDGLTVARGVSAGENRAFHLLRAIHMAGRCTGCGECERVCPAGVPVRGINAWLASRVEELFGYDAGRDIDTPPFLGACELQEVFERKGGGRV